MLKTKRNKIITLSVSAVVLIFTLVFIIISVAGNKGVTANTPSETSNTVQSSESSAKTEPKVTASPKPKTTAPKTLPKADKSEPESPEVDVTLAPVEVPDENVIRAIEENNIEVAPAPVAPQTAPPEQQSPNATTYINGQKYVWHPDFGWCPDYGEGNVIIMDVEDDGRRYEGY